jgi:hypothetical protein
MKTQTPRQILSYLIPALSLYSMSALADYDEFVRQSMDQAKQECASKGWVFEQNGNGSTCTPPNTNGRAIGAQAAGESQLSSPIAQERMNARITRPSDEAANGPIADTLPPNDDPRCEAYAHKAVNDARAITNAPGCYATGPRWDPNYQNHYHWCLTVPEAATDNEERERNRHLTQFCGRVNL